MRVRSSVLLSSIKIQIGKFNDAVEFCARGEYDEETRGDDNLHFTPFERFDGTLVRDSRRGENEEFLHYSRERRECKSAFRFLDSVKGKKKESVKKRFVDVVEDDLARFERSERRRPRRGREAKNLVEVV